MEEEKTKRVTKKNATMTLVTDLFVKLVNLYKDGYIIRKRIVVTGKESLDRMLGIPMCYLEPKYKEALETVIGSEVCYYIPSIKDTKIWLQQQTELEPTETIKDGIKKYIVPVTDKDEIDDVLLKSVTIEEKFNPVTKKVRWWQCIGDDEELVKTVFELRLIFDLPIATENASSPSVMTISKQILPLVTEKNIKNAYIGTTGVIGEEDDLMEVLLDFRFTHFRMMIVYKIVVLPITEEVKED